MPDEFDAPVWIRVWRNGALIHEWQVRDGIILSPPSLAGRTLGQGFASWALQTFYGNDLEAATILSRTWLIAIGRRYLIESAAGQIIDRNAEMIGRCFAYDRTRASAAVFTSGQTRAASDV